MVFLRVDAECGDPRNIRQAEQNNAAFFTVNGTTLQLIFTIEVTVLEAISQWYSAVIPLDYTPGRM